MKQLDQQRDLDRAALRKRERIVDANAVAGREIDDLRANHASRFIRNAVQLRSELLRENRSLRRLRA